MSTPYTDPTASTHERGLLAAARQKRALELRMAGYSYRQIADDLGYKTVEGALKAVNTALRKTLREPAQAVRTMELERIDAIWAELWDRRDKLLVVDRLVKLMEQRARLLGLNAPATSAMLNIDLSQLTDEQLQRLVEGEDILHVLGTPATTKPASSG